MTISVSFDEVVRYIKGELTNSRVAIALLVKSLLEKYGTGVLLTAKKALYQTGKIIGEEMAQDLENKNLQTLVKLMLSPPYKQIFDAKLEFVNENKAIIEWRICPLKDKLEKLGFSDNLIKTMCQVMEQYDVGIIEGFNPVFKCTPPVGPPEPCRCQISVKNDFTR